MKINENKIEAILVSIRSDVGLAYIKSSSLECDAYLQSARAKLDTLLSLFDFEE